MIKSFDEDTHAEEHKVILPFHGSIASIPEGWALADGSLGTMDMTDRFVRGLSNYGSTPGGKGGENSKSLNSSQIPTHRHTASVYSTGNHRHRYLRSANANSNGSTNIAHSGSQSDRRTRNAGSHSHPSSNTNNTGNASSIDNRPRFAELAFIQKL